MAIKQLSEEEVRTWSLEKKDRWWLENVFRGDMPQLTIRSALTGMLLGGVLCLTNLYVGAKTGWTLGRRHHERDPGVRDVQGDVPGRTRQGVHATREQLHAVDRHRGRLHDFADDLEPRRVHGGDRKSHPDGDDHDLDRGHRFTRACCSRFPLKRRFVNDEQLPFPEGRAAGVVMDALHSGGAKEGMLKAKILLVTGGLAALGKLLQSEAITKKLHVAFLHIPEYLDDWMYKLTALRIRGVDLRELTVRPDTDFVMMAAGGLMGIRTGYVDPGRRLHQLFDPQRRGRSVAGDVTGKVVDGVTHYGFRPSPPGRSGAAWR